MRLDFRDFQEERVGAHLIHIFRWIGRHNIIIVICFDDDWMICNKCISDISDEPKHALLGRIRAKIRSWFE